MRAHWLNDIGWAADRVYGHAHLLTIGRDDQAGAGSAAVDDEEELDEKHDIVDEDDRLDDDDLDDQPRGKRADKSARAYDDLKSERDRLKAENEKKDRLLQDLSTRVDQIERGGRRETRDEVNARTDEANRASQRLGREMAEKAAALDRNDPKFGEKLYAIIAESQQAIAEQASLNVSSQVVEHRLTVDEQRDRARKAALDELSKQGLSEEDFELVQAMAVLKSQKDPGWDKRMPNDEQIPYLVKELKGRMMKNTRNSPAFREEKDRHRADMDGVLGSGSRSDTRRGRGGDRDEGQEEGPGSILADLKRMRNGQRRDTNRMLNTKER